MNMHELLGRWTGRTELDEPRAIVLHPFRGLMFYSDWGDSPHIGRSGMDGSERIVIVGSDILGWPNALAVDLIADRLWWVDAKLDYIAVSNLDGTNMRLVLTDWWWWWWLIDDDDDLDVIFDKITNVLNNVIVN